MLIVLDQFEQWLHANQGDAQGPLAEALRQCDGRHLQCLLPVRKEYVTAVTRFVNQRLETRLSQDRNYALVDLFDKRHARRVLGLFGRAYGALPAADGLTDEQERFLEEAVDQLAQGDFVICVPPRDNNLCERALKKVILHRKNAMFYKTENGAHTGDIYMSLIDTCELCGANPFDYLTELQRHARELAANPACWMPWNYRQTQRIAVPQAAATIARP